MSKNDEGSTTTTEEPVVEVDEFEAAFDTFSKGEEAVEEIDDPVETEPKVEEETDLKSEDDKPEVEDDPTAALAAANEQIARLQQQVSSGNGRISAFQRKINDLQAPKPAKKEKAGEGDEDKDLSDFQNEYPEIAGPVRKLINAQVDQLESLTNQVGSITEVNQAKALADEDKIFRGVHPDFKEVSETSEFQDWVRSAPNFVAEALHRNGKEIVDGHEAAQVITMFKDQRAKPTPPESGNPKLSDKRKRQLESSSTVKSKGPGAASGPADDFETAFNYYAGKKK